MNKRTPPMQQANMTGIGTPNMHISKRIIRIIHAILFLALFCAGAQAQVALAPFTKAQYFDNSGHPLAGGRLYTYAAGTTTLLLSYKNSAGTIVNTNPVVLDSAGRADIWLTSAAYKFVLQNSLGTQIWTEDGITASNIALLGLNNIWTGTNSFNGAVTFNSSATFNGGITSVGPNNLSGGGVLNGPWTGSPSFGGTPNFTGGFLATTGTFSGQITSTLATGTQPFIIASQTRVDNLNADLLDNFDWSVPGPLGSTTPNSGVFTALIANTSFVLNGSPAMTAIDGTGTHLASSSAVTPATLAPACYDANDALTNVGCNAVPQIIRGTNTSTTCPTGGLTYDTCTYTITWSGTFATTSYIATCTGVGANDPRAAILDIQSKGLTTMVIRVVAEGSNPVSYSAINCIGVL